MNEASNLTGGKGVPSHMGRSQRTQGMGIVGFREHDDGNHTILR